MYAVDQIEVTLTVPSVEETAAWYERVLGWVAQFDAFDAEGQCVFGSVSRRSNDASDQDAFKGFNLSRSSSGAPKMNTNSCRGISIWVFVNSVKEVYERVVDSDARPDSIPKDQPWGGRLFRMRDLNGLKLTFVEMPRQRSEPA